MGEVARRLGKPLMPWQQHVADVILEIDPDTGQLVYGQYTLTVPRQSGKSLLLLAKAVHRASAGQFFGPRQQIVYAAQTRKDSRKKWEEDYLGALSSSSSFRRRVTAHLGNGNEHVRFQNGSRFGIESTTEKSGHGSTLDEGYVDEAFAQVDGRVEQAFRPAMITRPNAQLGVVSTAGWLDASPYLWAKVQHGRGLVEADIRTGAAYFEWSAPQDADPYNREVWRDCMPALGLMRPDGSGITEDKIAAELRAFEGSPEGVNGFRRAYLNQWVPKVAVSTSVIDPSAWQRLADTATAPAGHTGSIMLAVDTENDRSRTAIVAAGSRSDGLPMVELIEHRHGVDWAFAVLDKLCASNDVAAVVIDRHSQAATLIDQLAAAGRQVITTDTTQFGRACGEFYDAVVETERLWHLAQPDLTAAVESASVRPLRQTWAWARTYGSAPLIAASLATWGLAHRMPEPFIMPERYR